MQLPDLPVEWACHPLPVRLIEGYVYLARRWGLSPIPPELKTARRAVPRRVLWTSQLRSNSGCAGCYSEARPRRKLTRLVADSRFGGARSHFRENAEIADIALMVRCRGAVGRDAFGSDDVSEQSSDVTGPGLI